MTAARQQLFKPTKETAAAKAAETNSVAKGISAFSKVSDQVIDLAAYRRGTTGAGRNLQNPVVRHR
jgi:hypothetical protein